MKGKSGAVVVAHGIDVLLDHLHHLFAHDVPYPSREMYLDRLDRSSKATAMFLGAIREYDQPIPLAMGAAAIVVPGIVRPSRWIN
jgi:hypothetical protein